MSTKILRYQLMSPNFTGALDSSYFEQDPDFQRTLLAEAVLMALNANMSIKTWVEEVPDEDDGDE